MKVKRITWSQLYIVMGLIIAVALVMIDNGCFPQSRFPISTADVALRGFVTRSGPHLMLNGQPFRFAGANMHWLALDDSATYTSQFRVNDGLDAAQVRGVTVVRSHDLGISVGCSNCIEPSLGLFNESALAHVDYAIKAARDHGIRLIIPFTDNWHYSAGGKHTFTDWRHLSDENQFYFKSEVIGDFETYIRTLL